MRIFAVACMSAVAVNAVMIKHDHKSNSLTFHLNQLTSHNLLAQCPVCGGEDKKDGDKDGDDQTLA